MREDNVHAMASRNVCMRSSLRSRPLRLLAATSTSTVDFQPSGTYRETAALVLHVATVLTVVESITGELRVVPATFAFRE